MELCRTPWNSFPHESIPWHSNFSHLWSVSTMESSVGLFFNLCGHFPQWSTAHWPPVGQKVFMQMRKALWYDYFSAFATFPLSKLAPLHVCVCWPSVQVVFGPEQSWKFREVQGREERKYHPTCHTFHYFKPLHIDETCTLLTEIMSTTTFVLLLAFLQGNLSLLPFQKFHFSWSSFSWKTSWPEQNQQRI